MLELVAENAALEDALYYLDQGLTDGVITVDVFMKEVRRLARKQFVARATMKKVSSLVGWRGERTLSGRLLWSLLLSLAYIVIVRVRVSVRANVSVDVSVGVSVSVSIFISVSVIVGVSVSVRIA